MTLEFFRGYGYPSSVLKNIKEEHTPNVSEFLGIPESPAEGLVSQN